MHHSSSAQPLLLVIPGCVHSDIIFAQSNTDTLAWLLTKLLSVSTHKNTLGVRDIQGLPPYFGQFVLQDLYTAQLPLPLPLLPLSLLTADFTIYGQICSLPDSLPRPFPPCPAIGCFMQCQYTCEFWDRPKYEERPR